MPTLVTIADLRLRRDIAVDDEAVYVSMIDTVESMFETMTKRLWKYREGHVKMFSLDAENQRTAKRLFAPIFPINTTLGTPKVPQIEVKHWQTPDTESEAKVLEFGKDYQLELERGVVIRTMPSYWFDMVKMTVSGGYASANSQTYQATGLRAPPAPPADVVEAICRQVIYMRLRTQQDRIVLQSQSSLQSSVSFTYTDKPNDPMFLQVVRSYTRRTYGGYG